MARLASHSYGKTDVRLTQVRRRAEQDELVEISVNILLEGNFGESYTVGDNRTVLPTDTMKNTVYALARQTSIGCIETFGQQLAHRFVSRVPDVECATVTILQSPWARIGESAGAFMLAGTERRFASVRVTNSTVLTESGVRQLSILKTRDSAFSGFLRDEWTTLAETRDRLFATNLDATWTYRVATEDFDHEYAAIRQAMLDSFASHQSESVQHTLYAMGSAALAASSDISEIHLAMPNKHRLLVNLQPFGMENPNEIFVPTDEPSGYIEARIARE